MNNNKFTRVAVEHVDLLEKILHVKSIGQPCAVADLFCYGQLSHDGTADWSPPRGELSLPAQWRLCRATSEMDQRSAEVDKVFSSAGLSNALRIVLNVYFTECGFIEFGFY